VTYEFEPGSIYRMPTHFGPAPGPRQLPPGATPDPVNSPRRTSAAVSFLTEGRRLERHLPPGFTLRGAPVVTVEVIHLAGVDWLAGRGYSMVHVRWPVHYRGERDEASGELLAVVWENLPDAIISGREEIGHPSCMRRSHPREPPAAGTRTRPAGWDFVSSNLRSRIWRTLLRHIRLPATTAP
jgi:hypothetical protein